MTLLDASADCERLSMLETTRSTKHGPSFLRWAGSKRKSLSVLSKTFPGNDYTYVEPFAGSAALFFALRPAKAVLGDLNGHLVNTLRWVRDAAEEVHAKVNEMPRNAESYYRVRAAFNSATGDSIESAVMFVYLNRNCFNGLWRTNKLGQFNVPYGGTAMGEIPPQSLFEVCGKALGQAQIVNQDFRETLVGLGTNTFIFADPPYFTSTERTFIEYGKRSFGEKDLADLIDLLVLASERGAQVALTYNEAMPISDIPARWERVKFDVTRNVGGFKGARKKQGEIIYLSRVGEG